MNTQQTGDLFREYYLVFDNSDHIRPWMRRWFTKPGFEHVSVYMACEGGTICITQTMDNIEVYSWPYNIHAFMDTLAASGYAILYLPKIHKQGTVRWKSGIIIPSCVGLCQRITGISFNVITPHGYYKALLKHGAIPMGGKKPNDSLMKEQLAMQKKQQAEAESRMQKEEAAKEDLKKRQRLGRKSLLGTTGDELGVA